MLSSMTASKECSKCHRILPAESFNKAKWISSGLRSDCKDCYAKLKRERWAAKPVSASAKRRRDLAALKETGTRRCNVCEKVKPLDDEHFPKSGRWWDSSCRECARARTKAWAQENKERAKASAYERCAQRYAAKRHRMPKWLTPEHKKQISAVYQRARLLSQLTGVPYHVDHIVPLVGKQVSGLHVPWNLQAIPADENMRKHNTWNSSLEQALVATDLSCGRARPSGTGL